MNSKRTHARRAGHARRGAIALCALTIPLLATACGGTSKQVAASAKSASLSTLGAAGYTGRPAQSASYSTTTSAASAHHEASTRSTATRSASPSSEMSANRQSSSQPKRSSSSRADSKPKGGYSPAVESAINTFVSCMDEHGVKMAKPNFSGGPEEILSSKGIDEHSPQFQAAMNACGSDLIAVLRAGGTSLVPGS
jgi:hypothetical protein